MTVTEAMERLGISRVSVHQLVKTGSLVRTDSIGRNTMIDAGSVERLATSRTSPGRAWTERTTWAALALLSGQEAPWINGEAEESARSYGMAPDPAGNAVIRGYHTLTVDLMDSLAVRERSAGARILGELLHDFS
ncbi:helix-turn-helix domain-containing protein [Arthrobacter sp. A5]|uniref:helix-turn-helix domain-containing protein n=1 Tax=Arthrobacter sp. A5 TaxID=576926 RepID=UPI003DA953F6